MEEWKTMTTANRTGGAEHSLVRANTLSRRKVLASSAAALAAGALGSTFGVAATTGIKRYALGDFSVTILSDGYLVVPSAFLARNAPRLELEQAMTIAGQGGERVNTPTNITLVRTKSDLILIDTGSGPHFMPTAGKLLENMEAAGIDPRSITQVVYTHGHPDHLWGTLDDFDEEPNFPNASYVLSAAEWNLWMSGDVLTRIPQDRHNFAAGAARNLQRIKDKIRTIKPGEDIVTGLRAIDTAGHTQGHIAIEIVSGSEAILVIGDALAHPVIAFEHPDWGPAADHEPERAASTRRALLSRLAFDKTHIVGYHLPFPGIGFVERSGTGYRFTPTT
jgi:glyoxylase-like metal-dependent hydrolase (beta-lactamase superfamily II)